MFLKRIEIFGFKSFANRTVIEFADGITGIVGPNGCGKSNVVDALKWALGEQSVRNMRTERMDGVIFSGTDKIKALSVAEVTLIVSNENGYLEIDRPEISLQRRMYRNGENSYLLNGNPTRLKEIREIFLDTGVGKSAYSVIEQGRIDQVLSSRPEERRYLIEEAAGITRFKLQGSEGQKKLESTGANIENLDTIINELKSRCESLQKQTQKTFDYRRKKERIFEIECQLTVQQWKKINRRQLSSQNRYAMKETAFGNLREQIETEKNLNASQVKTLNKMQTELINYQKIVYGLDLEKKKQDEILKVIRNHHDESQKSVLGAKDRRKKTQTAVERLTESIHSRESEIQILENHIKKIHINIEKSGESITNFETQMENNLNEVKNLQTEFANEEENQQKLQRNLHEITDRIVKQLDKRLKESELNLRIDLRKKLQNLINESQILASENSESLKQSSRTGKPNETAILLDANLTRIKQLFQNYSSWETEFLQALLSPKGSIIVKRDLEEKMQQSRKRHADYKNKIISLSNENTSCNQHILETRKQLQEQRISEARTAAQATADRQTLQAIIRERKSEQERLKEINHQLIKENERTEQHEKQVRRVHNERERIDKEEENLNESIKELVISIQAQKNKLSEHETKLQNLHKRTNKTETEMKRFEIEMEHDKQEIVKIQEDFLERHSRDLLEFIENPEIENPEMQEEEKISSIRQKLTQAKEDLHHLGSVNLMAPEEFEEVSERYKFLNNQVTDLKKAKIDLEKLTLGIRMESTKRFNASLIEIRAKFHELFRKLFGGGRAEIHLENEDDPLSSGIEIYAQPPGKKLDNISLLSGGERAMCSLALMLALFKVKPSPFCVLDEIDAALDEMNVQRFVNLIKEFSRETQFLIITHNKKTIASTQNLIGITMQESGISSLITLSLSGEPASHG